MLKGLYSGRKIKATPGKLTRSQTGKQALNAIVKKYGKIVDSAKYMHKGKGNWVRYSIENDRKRTGKTTTSLKKWTEQPHKLDYKGKDTKKVVLDDNYKYAKSVLMNNPVDEVMLKYVSGKQKASNNIVKRALNGIPQKTWTKAFNDSTSNIIIEIRGGKDKRSSFVPYIEYRKIKNTNNPSGKRFAISQIKQAKPMGRNVRKQEMKHKPVLKTTEKMIEAKLLPLDVMRDAKIVKGVLTKRYKNIKFTVTSRKVWHGKNYGNGGAIDITYQSPNEIPEIDEIAQKYRKTVKYGVTGRKLNMPLRINLFVNHVKGPYKTTKSAPKTIKKKSKLYASAATLDGIKKLITKFYYGSNVKLEQVSNDEWLVYTGKGRCEGLHVKLVKNRYRFETTN